MSAREAILGRIRRAQGRPGSEPTAQELALRDNDMTTLGRCANNLGIIANMQGDYGRAVGAYTRAIAAYQKANCDRGVVESQHNLGITYREQGKLDDAFEAAVAAVAGAERLQDRGLKAQAIAGRAEIRIARGSAARYKRIVCALGRSGAASGPTFILSGEYIEVK